MLDDHERELRDALLRALTLANAARSPIDEHVAWLLDTLGVEPEQRDSWTSPLEAGVEMTEEELDGRLAERLRALWERSASIATIAEGKPNRIEGVGAEGVWISTEESERKGAGPQLVPAWMLNVAWRHLRATGTLTNQYLLAEDGLNVKRSSAVCALLACLPGVEVESKRPITLRFRG